MFDKLDDLLVRYEEIMNELSEPGVADNQDRFRKLMKEQNDLAPIVEAYKEYKANNQAIEDSLVMLEEETDEEMKELAKEELNESKARVEELEQKLEWILDATISRLKVLLGGIDPGNDLDYIVTEVSIIRYNRIGSEGFQSHTVEGESVGFLNSDFDSYMDLFFSFPEIVEKCNSINKPISTLISGFHALCYIILSCLATDQACLISVPKSIDKADSIINLLFTNTLQPLTKTLIASIITILQRPIRKMKNSLLSFSLFTKIQNVLYICHFAIV